MAEKAAESGPGAEMNLDGGFGKAGWGRENVYGKDVLDGKLME